MAWCRVSSLTAAVARTLKNVRYPANRSEILTATEGKTAEGWELSFFLDSALKRRRYGSLRAVMADLEDWAEKQG